MRGENAVSNSLCWKCRHAVPTETLGCSWSLDAIPVEGWDADYHKAKEKGHHLRDSYYVRSCPRFLPNCTLLLTKDKRDRMDGSPTAFQGLGMAVVTQCILDYREAYWQILINNDWLELCMKRRDEYYRVRDWIYAKKQRARSKRNQKVLDYMDDIHARFKKRFVPYIKYARIGYEAKKTVKSCEWFFQTEQFIDYSDMDGVRIMHMIQDELKDKYKKEFG